MEEKDFAVTRSGFSIRSYQETDAAAFAHHINDPETIRNFSSNTLPYPFLEENAERHIRSYRCHLEMEESCATLWREYTISVEDKMIGVVILTGIERGFKAEIGYWLGREFWGRGIMTEAVQIVTAHAVPCFDLKRIGAVTYPWNKGSMRVLEKAGFQFEGILRNNHRIGAEIHDDHAFSLVSG